MTFDQLQEREYQLKKEREEYHLRNVELETQIKMNEREITKINAELIDLHHEYQQNPEE